MAARRCNVQRIRRQRHRIGQHTLTGYGRGGFVIHHRVIFGNAGLARKSSRSDIVQSDGAGNGIRFIVGLRWRSMRRPRGSDSMLADIKTRNGKNRIFRCVVRADDNHIPGNSHSRCIHLDCQAAEIGRRFGAFDISHRSHAVLVRRDLEIALGRIEDFGDLGAGLAREVHRSLRDTDRLDALRLIAALGLDLVIERSRRAGALCQRNRIGRRLRGLLDHLVGDRVVDGVIGGYYGSNIGRQIFHGKLDGVDALLGQVNARDFRRIGRSKCSVNLNSARQLRKDALRNIPRNRVIFQGHFPFRNSQREIVIGCWNDSYRLVTDGNLVNPGSALSPNCHLVIL